MSTPARLVRRSTLPQVRNTRGDRPTPSFIASILLPILALCVVPPTFAQDLPDDFRIETVAADPGTKALGFALLPDERILTICHISGDVNLIVNGERREEPLVTIPNLKTSSEQGLLGIAIDPDFPDSNYVYIYYTSAGGTNRVAKFTVTGELNDPLSDDLKIDLTSERILLEMVDDSRYHNAGTLRFGSDKTLYVSHGDDVKFKFWEDNELYLQDLTNLYGKILRIHRDGSVPEDNPSFVSESGAGRGEIFAIGLRNPFRFSIDPVTDQLFIGDVGTNQREELNLASGGENFGYPRHEGRGFFYENADLTGADVTFPIHDYPKASSRAVVALVTYRQKNYPRDGSFPDEYEGAHFYADYFESSLRYLRPDGNGGWEDALFGTIFSNMTDAALGPDGSIYVMKYNGSLRKIVYDNPAVDTERPIAADAFELHQNHPNPFSDRTVVTYRLFSAGPVRLEVFDLLGRRVTVLVDEWRSAGSHSTTLRADDLPAGTYVYRLQTDEQTAIRTMVRVR